MNAFVQKLRSVGRMFAATFMASLGLLLVVMQPDALSWGSAAVFSLFAWSTWPCEVV
ncbi:hypothetical protein [Ferrimonas balearica]|uniref:hypothetical protein n=1 Tax=Ferrimonas balearica TaxID=44012 RepID=UPI001C9952AD|nr:hypothetical protein [Ferrimonas balearica]MBY5991464.1 hypothetical protein [Ferrimonas balearica]